MEFSNLPWIWGNFMHRLWGSRLLGFPPFPEFPFLPFWLFCQPCLPPLSSAIFASFWLLSSAIKSLFYRYIFLCLCLTKLLHHNQKLEVSRIITGNSPWAKVLGEGTIIYHNRGQRSLSYLLMQLTVPSWLLAAPDPIYPFLLMVDCYCTHPTLCHSASDTSQFMISSSDSVHWSNIWSLSRLSNNSGSFLKRRLVVNMGTVNMGTVLLQSPGRCALWFFFRGLPGST